MDSKYPRLSRQIEKSVEIEAKEIKKDLVHVRRSAEPKSICSKIMTKVIIASQSRRTVRGVNGFVKKK